MPNKLCTYSAVTLFTELTLMFFFFYRIGLMYWNLKEKKKSLPNLWRAQNGHFFHIWKNCKKRFFLPSPLLPWNLPMNFHQKVVFLHLESMPFKIKQRKRDVSGWKLGQTWHQNNCSHAKSTKKIYRHCLQSEFFSFLIWDRQLKFMFQHSKVWFDRKQLKYLSKELLLYDFLHKRSTDVW